MPTIINGTDNSASTPALVGTDTDTGVFFPAANTIALSTGGTEKVRVDSVGNVGIGGTSTGAQLYQFLAGGTTEHVKISGSVIARDYASTTLGSINYGAFSNHPVTFTTNNAERMRIDSSGNLLVGVTSGSAKFVVVNAGDAISSQTLVNNSFSTFVGRNLSGTATFFVSGAGAVTKASGTFRIEHPILEKAKTHDLVHSFIEGPNADLIYRGKAVLVNGKATVNIDTEARMTDGTFVLLCRNVQCFTTNETDWTAIKGSVVDNILIIEAQDATSAAEISWMVIGERKDKHMYETNWTDENGRPIVEPIKEEQIVKLQEQIDALKAQP